MSVALIQSPDDFALLEAGWFRSPSTTCPHCRGVGFWDCDHGDRIAHHGCQHCGGHAQTHGRGRVVVSPPEQCIPHLCPAPYCENGTYYCSGVFLNPPHNKCRTCGGSGVVAEPMLIGVEQCRHPILAGRWMDEEWGPLCDSPDRCCRRQALLVRVTLTGGPIPVVDIDDPAATQAVDGVITVDEGAVSLWYPPDYWGEANETILTDVLGGKVAPGDELWRCEVVHLAEPTLRSPLSLPLGEFVSLEMEQP